MGYPGLNVGLNVKFRFFCYFRPERSIKLFIRIPGIFTISSKSLALLKPSNTQTISSLSTLCLPVFQGGSLKTLEYINH